MGLNSRAGGTLFERGIFRSAVNPRSCSFNEGINIWIWNSEKSKSRISSAASIECAVMVLVLVCAGAKTGRARQSASAETVFECIAEDLDGRRRKKQTGIDSRSAPSNRPA